MQQYYFEGNLEKEIKILNLKKQEKHNLYKYLVKVVKIKIKELIIIANGITKAKYEVSSVNKEYIVLNKVEDIEIDKQKYNISLLISPLKKDNTELILQKTCEIGIDNIILSQFQNTIVKINDKIEKKINRYKEILISGMEQSKRNTVPHLEVTDLKKINFEQYDIILVCHEKNNNFINNEIEKLKNNSKILIIIGPEGGISPEEITFFEEIKNVVFVSLGKNILRAETAAVVTSALVKNKLEYFENNN